MEEAKWKKKELCRNVVIKPEKYTCPLSMIFLISDNHMALTSLEKPISKVLLGTKNLGKRYQATPRGIRAAFMFLMSVQTTIAGLITRTEFADVWMCIQQFDFRTALGHASQIDNKREVTRLARKRGLIWPFVFI